MPHQCTDCGRAFDDGSKEMLSGCPNCGGNTFQFKPDGDAGADDQAAESADPPSPPEPAVDSSVARTVGSAATAVRDLMGSGQSQGPPEAPSTATDTAAAADASAESTAEAAEAADAAEAAGATASASEPPAAVAADASAGDDGEDAAQASARSDVVPKESLPPAPDRPLTTEESVARQRAQEEREPARDDDRPDLADLREELNEQFESIKVLEPGQYELNLMELYDREEYIIALQEDGKYTIQVPDGWQD
jgi:hypothetical protein